MFMCEGVCVRLCVCISVNYCGYAFRVYIGILYIHYGCGFTGFMLVEKNDGTNVRVVL